MKKSLYFLLLVSFTGLRSSENTPTPPPRKAYFDQFKKLQARIAELEKENERLSKENAEFKRVESLLLPSFALSNKACNIKLTDGISTALNKLRKSEEN